MWGAWGAWGVWVDIGEEKADLVSFGTSEAQCTSLKPRHCLTNQETVNNHSSPTPGGAGLPLEIRTQASCSAVARFTETASRGY